MIERICAVTGHMLVNIDAIRCQVLKIFSLRESRAAHLESRSIVACGECDPSLCVTCLLSCTPSRSQSIHDGRRLSKAHLTPRNDPGVACTGWQRLILIGSFHTG